MRKNSIKFIERFFLNKWFLPLFAVFIALIVITISLYVQSTNTKDEQRSSQEAVEEVSEEVVPESESSPTPAPSNTPLHSPDETRTSSPSAVKITKIQAYIQKVFTTEKGCAWANCVADCESGYDPYAENPAGYYGLFQFHPSTYRSCGGIDVFDWRQQVRVAKCMYDAGRMSEFPVCSARCQ